MKAVARLVWSYFTGTPWLCWLTVAGAATILGGFIAMIWFPQSFVKQGITFAGVCAFFLGSSLMPLMFGRMARSRQICVLPYGRLKLFASALLTTLIVTLPLPVGATLSMIAGTTVGFLKPAFGVARIEGLWDLVFTAFFWNMVFLVFLLYSWLYMVLWFVTSSRTAVGLMRGLLVLVAMIYSPTRYGVDHFTVALGPPLWIAITWSIFAAYFFALPRLTKLAAARPIGERIAGIFTNARHLPNHEIDLMLGTSRPWTMAAMQVLPLLLAAKLVQTPESWLFCFVLFSTVSSAVASTAAMRSRALWLRANWSRAELFAQVEYRFWIHNGCVLSVVLLLLVIIGNYKDLPATVMLCGIPLLILATAASTYLGLMMTHGLRMIETLLGIGTMLLSMLVAVFAVRGPDRVDVVVVLELLLAGLAVIYRFEARRRWNRLDWMLCRPDAAASKRTS